MNFTQHLLGAIDNANEGIGRLVKFLILLINAAVVLAVVARYVFNSPLVWVHEVSIFAFGTHFVLTGGYVLLHEGHVRMDVIYRLLRPRVKAIVDLITAPIFFLFVFVLLWQGGAMTLHSWKIHEVNTTYWAPVLWPFKMLVPIGAILLLMQGVAKFIRDFICIVSKN
jgi:TRAP-type mannitol/chloroaromatic compound transport system permease small subunit